MSLSQADGAPAAENVGGGTASESYATLASSHGRRWYAGTTEDHGNTFAYHVDNNGDAFNVEYD